jgi:OmpA-OmpF porin, OOP family
MHLAKTVVVLIMLFVVSLSQAAYSIAAPPKQQSTPYSTADTYSFSLNSGGLYYTGTGSHIFAPLYGIKFGYDAPGTAIINSFGTEASLYYFSSKSPEEGGDTTGFLFRVDEVLPFTPGKRLVPFAAVGAGGIYTSNENSTKVLPFLNYGAGLKYFLSNDLALRADVRHILAMTIGGIDNFEISAGLSYYFGKKSTKKLETAPEAKKTEDKQKTNGKIVKSEKEQKEKEQKELEQREKERAEQELKAQERRKQEKLDKERLQKEWEAFEARQQEKIAGVKKPEKVPSLMKQTVKTTVQPSQPPIAATPEAPGTIPALAGEIAPEIAAVPLTPPVQAVPPAAVVTDEILAGQEVKPPVKETKLSAAEPGKVKIQAIPPAKTATAPAPTETMAIPAPAGEIAPEIAAVPLTPPVQAVPPAAVVTDKALAGKELKTPVAKAEHIKAEPEKAIIIRELLINFDFDKSVVKKIYQSQIKQIADFLKSNPGYSVIIEGHTDSIGSMEYNLKLSQQRSNSVKNSIVRLGVAPKRITAKGYSFTRPVATNSTPEGRRKNRRAVMISVVTSEVKSGSK